MPKFRKKPVVIEAMLLDPDDLSIATVSGWMLAHGCDKLLALPDPTPAVQDAIDDGDDFDAHVDQPLTITNLVVPRRDQPHMHGVCGPCGGRVICFRDGAEAVEHLRSHGREAADLAPDFCCTPAELAEDLAAGFSIEAMAVQEFRATGSCTHTPKWGVER